MALAKLAAVFPVELALHALVIHLELPYLATVSILAVAATILVIWVVEPGAMRYFARWLHAPELRHRDRLDSAEQLWRIRVRLDNKPGSSSCSPSSWRIGGPIFSPCTCTTWRTACSTSWWCPRPPTSARRG